MTAYSVLQARVLDWLNRDDLTSAQIDSFISLAEARFNRTLMVPGREQTSTAVTTTDRIAVPSDFWAMRALYVDGQVDPQLTQMSLVDLVREYTRSGASAGDLRHYAISGTEIVLGPTPGSSTTITLVYYETIPALTSTNTSNWLIVAHPDLYLSATLAEAYLFMKDESRAGIWDSRTQAKIDEIEKAGRRKQNGAAPLVARGAYRTIPRVRA